MNRHSLHPEAMPPKQGGKNKTDESKEEPLAAVVVADTFETKFAPFTADRPRCLLPLCNTPLIEYTLEYLVSAGVQDVFFYAGAHTEQVEAYLEGSKWLTKSSPFNSFRLLRCMATSVGDVMRDLDQKELVKGDFVCVSGDIVSNFPLRHALRAHKARRAKDQNAVMTLCLRERTTSDHSPAQMTPTFVIDPIKDRCLYYEETSSDASFGVHIDTEMLGDILKSAELDIRQDLIDCRIDICAPAALHIWSENFDNQKPRTDFLSRTLKDSLNDKTIHTFIVEGYYADRVSDPAAYARITADLRGGVASSLRITNNIGGTNFRRQRNNVSKEADVIIQKSAIVDVNSIIGESTTVGAGAQIRKSVLGRRCNIGKTACVRSAYIWDDVTIGSATRIERAIIGGETFVGDNCVINEGALVGFGANIPAGTTIPAGAKVHKQTNFSLFATTNGTHARSKADNDDLQTEHSGGGTLKSIYLQPGLVQSMSSIASDVSEMSTPTSAGGSRTQSFATHTSDEDGTERFQLDTVAILSQRMQEGKHVDDMQSELMGLRFSGGADEAQVRRAVAVAITRQIQSEVSAGSTPQQATRKTLEKYRYLIRRQNAEQSMEEQIVFLVEAQNDLVKRTDGARIIPYLVKDLYDMEVFEEDVFTSWYVDERSQQQEIRGIRTAAKPFIDWLAEADEDDSDEEEEEDDDD